MGILDRLRSLRRATSAAEAPDESSLFKLEIDSNGATWTADAPVMVDLEEGAGPAILQDQFIVLSMLAEADDALKLPGTGFTMSVDQVSRLGDEVSDVLGLPPSYDGEFDVRRRHNTTSPEFEFTARALRGQHSEGILREGACLLVGSDRFRLTTPLVRALEAIEAHSTLPAGQRDEVSNVRLIAQLQKAERDAKRFTPNNLEDEKPAESAPGTPFPLDLGYFSRFQTIVPERIGLTVEEQSDGSLRLSPDLGTGHDPSKINERKHHINIGRDENVLRVDSQFVLLEKRQMEGVREIFRTPHIPAERVQEFYEAPGSFIDPAKVQIDVSFSVRVKGIGILAPVSFNDASDTGISWIDDAEEILAPEILADMAETEDELTQVEDAVDRARTAGSSVATVGTNVVDISDEPRVETALNKARKKFIEPAVPLPAKPDDAVQVGVILHEVESLSSRLRRTAIDAEPGPAVDYSGLLKEPYPHQREGIEWISKLMGASLGKQLHEPTRIQGGLLADDMGLGKTFMTLVALRQFMDLQRGQGRDPLPMLAVLPLSLIENWKDEINETFRQNPFEDVIVLQSNEDLNMYKYRGARRETSASASLLDEHGMLRKEGIVFSLAVGDDAGEARLDKPGRLVLTTYETLASFQISLSHVEWGAVVFDEAQKTKNPETLASRAAKGLKAWFKLICTGTPVENKLKDLWCLMDTAQPGLLGTWPEFNKEWVRSVEGATSDIRTAKGGALADHVRPFMLRRNKQDHLTNLPSKTIHSGVPGVNVNHLPELYRTMPQEQAHRYSQELSAHRARVGQKGAALKTLQALKAVSLHPSATTRGIAGVAVSPDTAARVQATFEILDRVRDADEKAIVFVINKAVQRMLVRWIQLRYSIPVHVVNGDTQATAGGPSPSRKQLISTFQKRPGFGVIIMSPVAAGTGLTVTEANHAIHLERHWNPAKEAQATDRIYRIGQKRPVNVYLPLAIHPDESIRSFDLNLNQLLQQKSDLKDAVVVPEVVSEKDMMSALGLE